MAWWKNWLPSLLLVALTALAQGKESSQGLLKAVYEDRSEDALKLLKGGADASKANRYGVTPLALACGNGNLKLVKALVAHGAKPNELGKGEESVLMVAARTGRPEVVKFLLSKGAKADHVDAKGQTALLWAAVEGHAEVVDWLLREGADQHKQLKSGFNAWFFAARQGHTDVINVLLSNKADVNAGMENSGGGGRTPRKGTSALILAIENGHFELAAHLLKVGANPNDTRSGASPLHVLSWVRKPRRGDGIDGAPPPKANGNLTSLEFVDVLIAGGADVNLQLGGKAGGGNRLSRAGATPFLMAARTADLPFMKRLLKHGADFRRPNKQGRTPLLAAAGVALGPEADEAASEADALLAVDYLLKLGAKIDVVDKEGDTVMHAAAYKQAPKLVNLLAERGADIKVWHQKNRKGWTPLLIAQGFRYGNFKPSDPTIKALSKVMRARGVEPPKAPPRPGTGKRENYEP